MSRALQCKRGVGARGSGAAGFFGGVSHPIREASPRRRSIADLQEIEERIARLLTEYGEAADRRAWLREHFDSRYPEGATDREVITDVLSLELNAKFTSVFRCPHCGRLATKGPEDRVWRFFEAAPPAG